MPDDPDFPPGERETLMRMALEAFNHLGSYSLAVGDYSPAVPAEKVAAKHKAVLLATSAAVAYHPCVVKLLRAAYPDSDDVTRRRRIIEALASAFNIGPGVAEDIVSRLDGPGGGTVH